MSARSALPAPPPATARPRLRCGLDTLIFGLNGDAKWSLLLP